MMSKYGWIFTICFILGSNMAAGHAPLGSTYDFPQPEGPAFGGDLSSRLARNTADLRLATLRAVMVEEGVDASIIPTADAHNSPRIAPVDARRAWLTGFGGDAGTAVVTSSEALVWTDGRFWAQFELETDSNIWQLMREGIDVSLHDWLVKNLPPGSVVGVDPTLYSITAWNSLEITLMTAGIILRAEYPNMVDVTRQTLNDGPPERPNNSLIPLDITFTGRRATDKIGEAVQMMTNAGTSALVLTALDEIAYVLNLRGSDIPYTPLFYSYLIIKSDGGLNSRVLFTGNGTLSGWNIVLHQIIEGITIQARPYEEFVDYLTNYSAELGTAQSIWVPADANRAVVSAIVQGGARAVVAPVSPIALMKLTKTSAELRGFRNVHITDAVALVRGLSWLESQLAEGVPVTEIRLADELEILRREEGSYMGPSFPTIVAAGSNSAIMHYLPQRSGPQRVITTDDMLLIDSGGQYLDGTTDITRTRHMGNCSEEQRHAFTHVLKGNINLATSVMPRGTKGHSIDVLARKFLWDIGLDYAHDTGHGVGHFLHVREYPAMINSLVTPNDPGIAPNMIYSIEPGYYEEGEYGIRHEDIVETINVSQGSNHLLAADIIGDFLGQGAVGFSAITQVPHQTSCLNVSLLTEFEINYINEFHARVFRTISPILRRRNLAREFSWLERECAPIGGAAILKISIQLLAAISVFVVWLG